VPGATVVGTVTDALPLDVPPAASATTAREPVSIVELAFFTVVVPR
jgi:hypothetical protein